MRANPEFSESDEGRENRSWRCFADFTSRGYITTVTNVSSQDDLLFLLDNAQHDNNQKNESSKYGTKNYCRPLLTVIVICANIKRGQKNAFSKKIIPLTKLASVLTSKQSQE